MTHTCPESPSVHVSEYIYICMGMRGHVEETTEQKREKRSKNAHLHRVGTLWESLRDMIRIVHTFGVVHTCWYESSYGRGTPQGSRGTHMLVWVIMFCFRSGVWAVRA